MLGLGDGRTPWLNGHGQVILPALGSHSVPSQGLIIKPQLELGETHVNSIETSKKAARYKNILVYGCCQRRALRRLASLQAWFSEAA